MEMPDFIPAAEMANADTNPSPNSNSARYQSELRTEGFSDPGGPVYDKVYNVLRDE